MITKLYIGDAVYVVFDGSGILLTTEDGIKATNQIYLEPETLANLLRYVSHLTAVSLDEESQA